MLYILLLVKKSKEKTKTHIEWILVTIISQVLQSILTCLSLLIYTVYVHGQAQSFVFYTVSVP